MGRSVRRRRRARKIKVMSRPIVLASVGKAVSTRKENMEETALRIPLQLDLAWLGNISEDIRFGKLSGPICIQNVSREIRIKGAYL